MGSMSLDWCYCKHLAWLPDSRPFQDLVFPGLLLGWFEEYLSPTPLPFTMGSLLWVVHIYQMKYKPHFHPPNSSLMNINHHVPSAVHTVLCGQNAFPYLSPVALNAILPFLSVSRPASLIHLTLQLSFLTQ